MSSEAAGPVKRSPFSEPVLHGNVEDVLVSHLKTNVFCFFFVMLFGFGNVLCFVYFFCGYFYFRWLFLKDVFCSMFFFLASFLCWFQFVLFFVSFVLTKCCFVRLVFGLCLFVYCFFGRECCASFGSTLWFFSLLF